MSHQRILVVEDDSDMRALLTRVLSQAGFQVEIAVDGLGGVSNARKSKPDAIVLDIGLPGGDGFTVLERIRSMTPLAEVPVLVVTGQEDAALEARKAGATAFMRKPIEPDELLSRLGAILPA